MATSTCTYAPTAAQPAAKQSKRPRRQQSADHRHLFPLTFEQGRSPASVLITGCRGHPCPRKCETHGGFHYNKFLGPKNLTPNPFPRGKGNRIFELRLVAHTGF